MEIKIIDGINYLLNEITFTAIVIHNEGYSGDIVIPETIVSEKVSYKVTTIGYTAFENCKSLTSITIPNSVMHIEGSAFEGCESLASINIPDGVIVIGNWAFDGCESLSSINIHDNVTSIGWSAFRGCKSLTSINIPNCIITIESNTFSGCKSLVDIRYNGTIEQWNKIKFYTDLGDEWNKGVPTTIAHCSDGDCNFLLN